MVALPIQFPSAATRNDTPKIVAPEKAAHEADYARFAEKLVRTGIISDPWLYGQERFSLSPVVLSSDTYEKFCRAAEAIGKVYDELSELVWQHPEWLDEFFHLTPFQKLMWLSSGGNWHAIARLDVFLCADGRIQICEMNSDTPSGEAEAVILNQLFHQDVADCENPNETFETQFIETFLSAYRASVKEPSAQPSVGIIYPTDMPEDLSMILIYKSWFEKRGCNVVLGSPFNLYCDAERKLLLLNEPIDLAVRHYKTDWWGERLPVWKDGEDYPDPYPLDHELYAVLKAEEHGTVVVLNPFGAVVTQNKLSMALCWKAMSQFSHAAQEAIRAYLPETYRLADAWEMNLLKDKNDWVLKSDYGCEGADVIIGKFTDEATWKLSLDMAITEHWVVQRYFEAAPINGKIPNYGIYLLGGAAAGVYTRLSDMATDYTSLTAATYIKSVP